MHLSELACFLRHEKRTNLSSIIRWSSIARWLPRTLCVQSFDGHDTINSRDKSVKSKWRYVIILLQALRFSLDTCFHQTLLDGAAIIRMQIASFKFCNNPYVQQKCLRNLTRGGRQNLNDKNRRKNPREELRDAPEFYLICFI